MSDSIFELMREMETLAGSGLDSILDAAIKRARAESDYAFKDHMVGHVRDCIAKENLGFGTTKAAIIAKADELYKNAIKEASEAKFEALKAAAIHQHRMNRFNMCQSLLVAEQSLLKHTS